MRRPHSAMGAAAAIIVPVFVNGVGPFDFVLDTGATFTCLEPMLSRRLTPQEP
ncbi:MAG TPA: hypothetical protein VFQ76_03610 [Longimicrobiaceae bacterium]|nr:hypothetical protein [Longimicrobiaceae bacterium]